MPREVPESGACVSPSVAGRFKMVVANRQLWPLVLVGLGSYGSYSTLFHNWVVIYLMQICDVQRDFAANLVLIAGLGIMLGAPAFGFLSDRTLRRRLPLVMSTGLVPDMFGGLDLVERWQTAPGGSLPLVLLHRLRHGRSAHYLCLCQRYRSIFCSRHGIWLGQHGCVCWCCRDPAAVWLCPGLGMGRQDG